MSSPAACLAAEPTMPTNRPRRYDRVKRVFDVVGAATALVVGAPLLAGVALLILATLGRPVFFRQVRPGRDGELFEMVKFRTMLEVDPARGLVTDADRLTPVGRWLRATSLDELPELWNVLRGEMSLVGPRPHLVKYLEIYTPWQARRHEVRPGITGLAQVRGRNELAWEDKFAYDIEYVDNRGLRLDLRIMVETVRVVLRREGIAAPGAATWHEFTGTPTPPDPVPTGPVLADSVLATGPDGSATTSRRPGGDLAGRCRS
ncbi:lipopolysaccharide/colanic/teichoic acid biosynthesis glycosyltransferase [Micromonospora sp. Llam0]|uniref:sugar transferase n=1 Tax=Micromonospora sp. Llam0 TaxID=2485143 RepID=UPI000F9BB491|nr:sugar transferase [Micromonospora sp. Llam0]ROO60160.1 lipopolysaccharide/colanic/teichoic acid biosynthesis glycosyltransferase [Micromonospora sp. Llam0]